PVLALAGQLRAQPVDVVVVAVDGDDVRPVDAGREDLRLLEVGGDEDVRLDAERGGLRGDGVREIAGRRAGEDLEAELAGASARGRSARRAGTARSIHGTGDGSQPFGIPVR